MTEGGPHHWGSVSLHVPCQSHLNCASPALNWGYGGRLSLLKAREPQEGQRRPGTPGVAQEAQETPGKPGKGPGEAREGPGRPREAREGPGRPREAREGPGKPREAREGPGRLGKAREAREGPERPRKARESQGGPGRPGKAQGGPGRPREASLSLSGPSLTPGLTWERQAALGPPGWGRGNESKQFTGLLCSFRLHRASLCSCVLLASRCSAWLNVVSL